MWSIKIKPTNKKTQALNYRGVRMLHISNGFSRTQALDINGGTKEAPPQQHGSDQFVMRSETEKDFDWRP